MYKVKSILVNKVLLLVGLSGLGSTGSAHADEYDTWFEDLSPVIMATQYALYDAYRNDNRRSYDRHYDRDRDRDWDRHRDSYRGRGYDDHDRRHREHSGWQHGRHPAYHPGRGDRGRHLGWYKQNNKHYGIPLHRQQHLGGSQHRRGRDQFEVHLSYRR